MRMSSVARRRYLDLQAARRGAARVRWEWEQPRSSFVRALAAQEMLTAMALSIAPQLGPRLQSDLERQGVDVAPDWAHRDLLLDAYGAFQYARRRWVALSSAARELYYVSEALAS